MKRLSCARKIRPQTFTIAYHKAVPDPRDDNPGFVSFDITHRICWKKGEGAPIKDVNGRMEADSDHIGGCLPTNIWFSVTGCVAITWCMRWSVQGLAPARPNITYAGDTASIPPGRALMLTELP